MHDPRLPCEGSWEPCITCEKYVVSGVVRASGKRSWPKIALGALASTGARPFLLGSRRRGDFSGQFSSEPGDLGWTAVPQKFRTIVNTVETGSVLALA